MGNEMITYLQQLEILAFFSGYPLIYAIAATIKSTARSGNSIKRRMFTLLPFAYAISGILYAGLQLRNLCPDLSYDHISSEIQIPFYAIWGFTSILFFLPALNKKPFISLLHSSIFFYLMAKNYYLEISGSETDPTVLKNYMKIYFDSIILNIAIIIALLIINAAARYLKEKISPIRR